MHSRQAVYVGEYDRPRIANGRLNTVNLDIWNRRIPIRVLVEQGRHGRVIVSGVCGPKTPVLLALRRPEAKPGRIAAVDFAVALVPEQRPSRPDRPDVHDLTRWGAGAVRRGGICLRGIGCTAILTGHWLHSGGRHCWLRSVSIAVVPCLFRCSALDGTHADRV